MLFRSGEVSAAALILGGIYLIARKVISWRIPVIYIATTAILLIVFGKADVVVPQLFAGGLMLGAFFMATDYTTSPISAKGQIIFAFGRQFFPDSPICGRLVQPCPEPAR